MEKRVAAALLMSVFCLASASAEIRDIPLGPIGDRLPDEVRACLSTGGTVSQRVQLRGARATATAPLDTDCPSGIALSAFSLSFQGSDHKLNTIGITREGSNVRFDLADQNGDDTFSPSATFVLSGEIVPSEVSAVGFGEMNLDLPAGPAGHVPVLQGFKLFRQPGTDANVRLIGVQIIDDASIRVALVHDGGGDFRSIEDMMDDVFGWGLIPFVGPLVQVSVPSATAVQVLRNYPDNYYGVTVQVGWVPEDNVIRRESISGARGGGRRPQTEGSRPAEDEQVAIQGFRFYFENSDHHIKSIKVTLATGSSPATIGDSDGEDPYAFAVDYLTLE